MKSIIVALLLALSFVAAPLSAEEKIGVVLMHGKWGTSSSNSPIAGLADFLENAGILVSVPDMPWSKRRGLDKSYEDSLAEIDDIVNRLKDKGATRIVIGGHSMGANAALGYGARKEGLAGIMAIAPGHTPEQDGFQARMDHDWQRAQKMVDAGQGDAVAEFKDINQGKVSQRPIRAAVYLNWYNPDGPAVMPVNAANLKAGTPLLWVVGEEDRMYERGEEYAFSNAPAHPNNAYIVVQGGHKETPQKGKEEILRWLKNL